MMPTESGNFSASEAARWNALNRGDNPFIDRRFLVALEQAGCVGAASGWEGWPVHNDSPEGYAPAWLKQHSRGEFVFDFVWADAAHRAGMHWYPKLLVAAPLTPVTGPRLLAEDDCGRAGVVDELQRRVHDQRLSSCAVNFCDRLDCEALDAAGWLARFGWQFHWCNRGYRDFDDFLQSLRAKPRKNIRRERRLAHAGWHYRFVDGDGISKAELALVCACYQTTFMLYGNLPTLNQEFFSRAARAFGRQFVVCIAARDGTDLACSVFWRNATHLYGRYWGALEETSDVHFEACYYQGIEYCIEHGLQTFEPGAQGEHKIRRGFEPVRTFSYHYIAHPQLRTGIANWLDMESRALDEYRSELQPLIPYRESQAGPA